MTAKSPDAVKKQERFYSKGNGGLETTLTQTEAMQARGYHQLADGTWVP